MSKTRDICYGVYCVDCPMLELLDEAHTEGDMTDAFNSMLALKSTFIEKRDTRFDRDEVNRLESLARQIGRYTDKTVSRVAVKSLERQLSGTCDLLKEGE